MPEIDRFAKQLFEEAKRLLEKAKIEKQQEGKQAYLHAALMLGFCAFEAHINSVSEDFIVRTDLNPLERAILSEREHSLENGEYIVTSKLKIFRLTDRIEFIFRKFSGKPIDKTAVWWSKLKTALATRNELTHPKEKTEIQVEAVESALLAIISTLDNLYRAVYKKPYPPMNRGLDSNMTF
jgi:hypothetical protein